MSASQCSTDGCEWPAGHEPANKHDADCLHRKHETGVIYLCTCGLSDGQVGQYDRDGRPYHSGVNCMECGRFVGTDGSIETTHEEMSSTIAYVEGTCARCLDKEKR